LISTVEKILTGFKNWSRQFKNDISTNLNNFYSIKSRFLFLSWSRLSISTFQKLTSRLLRKSWHLQKVSLDARDVLNLDLNWSRLSRALADVKYLTLKKHLCLFFQVEGGNKLLNYRNEPKRQLDKQTFNLIKLKKISNLWKRLIKTITIRLIGTQITVT
jgi:hypothetical protein